MKAIKQSKGNPIAFSYLIVMFTLSILSYGKSTTQELFSDTFESPSSKWQEIYLEGDSGGSYAISDGKLTINVSGGARYGVYRSKPISGHFYAEAAFEEDENIGLALIQEKNGKPDIQNFTMLCVTTNQDGNVVVSVRDRQNGVDNVLDNTGKLGAKRTRRRPYQDADTYEHVLTGRQYSVPFDKTNKKIRIFRDGPAGFFHFYYAVKKNIRGKEAEGWMELAPSKDWAKPGQNYYVALIACSEGKAVLNSVKGVQKPQADQDDTKTGFKATRREYNWSGFFGDAVVITFGDDFKYRDKDIKFVFWSEMNYVPAWHLHNQLLFTYEFVETWGGGNPGCHEPMSDRLLRWSRVKIVEDNDVRKVVHWHYVLCDPDYRVPDNDKGTQVPEVDEYWTFYPDGSGTRYFVYTPKLDTDFRESHELAELISIAGSLSHSKEFFSSPALTLFNLDGDVLNTHPGPKFDFGSKVDDWDQILMAVHLKNEPDVFYVFSMDSDIPETYSGYKVRHEIAWQSVNGRSAHWPVNKRPFTGNNGSGGTWEAEVSHSCLISCDVRDGISWEDHFKIDSRGRKYRDWVSLIGLNKPNDLDGLREKTKSWLYPGSVKMLEASSKFIKNDYNEKALVFENTQANQKCYFEINPGAKNSVLINPVLRIKKWGLYPVGKIMINDVTLSKEKYKVHMSANSDVLIWINTKIDSKTKFKIDRG